MLLPTEVKINGLDDRMGQLVDRFGFAEVIGALARCAFERAADNERAPLFRRLNKLYEQVIDGKIL